MPSPSQSIERRNPAKHHVERRVSRMKSAIMDRNDTKTRLLDKTLNASLGTRTGAPMASTSRAC